MAALGSQVFVSDTVASVGKGQQNLVKREADKGHSYWHINEIKTLHNQLDL